MELSACIEWLYAEGGVPMADRIRRAAADGMNAVEFWFWRSQDIAAIGSALRATGVRLTSFVSEPVGRLVDPSTHAAFLAGVAESSEVAQRLGCGNLVVLSGVAIDGMPRDEQKAAVVVALRAAGPLAARHGVRLVLEPLSEPDEPGNFLKSTALGLDIIDAVGEPNVALLYDLFHAVTEGENLHALDGRVDRIGHVQVADVPGRHEPGTGTISWEPTLGWLRRAGYEGPVGLEYMPLVETHASLEYVRAVAASQA
jgi:hydroxypyruvate isomerase